MIAATAALASSAGAASHAERKFPTPPSAHQAEATLQRIQLLCQDQSASGSCPTPREQCKEECWDTCMEDTFRCQTGAEGILDWQRNICHGKATVRYGACNIGCDREHPW